MLERIEKLTQMTVSGELFFEVNPTEYDRTDLFLPPLLREAKQAKEYILNQTPLINDYTALTGFLRFTGDVKGDIFYRSKHTHWQQIQSQFYNRPIDGLCTFEWQHSVADFEKVIRIGINGFKQEIAASKAAHRDTDALEFLTALDITADAIIAWAEKCAVAAEAKANESTDPAVITRLQKLAAALRHVPANPARTFYEAILTVFMIYAFVPDSIGTIDRYLFPFYEKELADGTLTNEEATAYLQELFLMLQARISIKSDRFYRGGESHFCIGGYTENGEDGFNALSKLVLESLLELPTWIPEISFRWTQKTPFEILRYVMDCERKDPHKRIAFVSDEPRIKALMEIAGFPFELACKYTMVGCNEPQLPGGIFMGGCAMNLGQVANELFYTRATDLCAAADFDSFYTIFEQELTNVLTRAVDYYNKFQAVRARDINFISSMFFTGAIERAKSITCGGAKDTIANLSMMGIITMVDCLSIVRQFVYEEKRVSMQTLLKALQADWIGYEDLHADILKRGKFFGNNEPLSNDCANRFAASLTNYFRGKTSDLGYPFLVGNLNGYNQHNKWFGESVRATPDGRKSGDPISFGIYQDGGKDREGLTALLASVAQLSSSPILNGDSVTNILLEEQLIKDDALFEKTVQLFETYFKMGGVHYQLNYVSRAELLAAKADPQKYRSLRVRVSGFSDYFRHLNDDIQDEIIRRTEVHS